MKVYKKAVRDSIPQIIQEAGKRYEYTRLQDEEFLPHMEQKLQEELHEYYHTKEVEELADLLEVIYRIASLKGISAEKLDRMRMNKKNTKGGFEMNYFLLQAEE